MLTIIDTKAGNFNSIIHAFNRIGIQVNITDNIKDINLASALILPGVSAFARGMDSLYKHNLIDIIRYKVSEEKTPILGICLGMQLLASTSTENGITDGLDLIKGNVVKLEPNNSKYKVPNIGWCDVNSSKQGIIFNKDYSTTSFYHVHSYHLQCDNSNDIAATIDYNNQNITVAIEQDNIFGVQFHPEKSQDAGLDLLSRFVKHISSNTK